MLAYVDESGDEGTLGRGSRWLVFGCVMVADADVQATRESASTACKIAGHGQRRWLHFTDLTHDDRHGCIEIFNQASWAGVLVASDTTKVNAESILDKPLVQYSYAARYVVERVSAWATEVGEPATIYFEDRGNFDLEQFRQYMQRVIDNNGSGRINPLVIDPGRIHQMSKGPDEILCMADALAYSGFRSLEPHRVWKRYERSYFDALLGKLWRGPAGRENLHRWGLVLMPTGLWDSAFTKEYPWLLTLPKT